MEGHFWQRISNFQVVQSTKEIYVTSKERHVLLGRGLGLLESGVLLASGPVKTVMDRVPGLSTSKLDGLACACLDKVETQYSKLPSLSLREQPQKLIKQVRGSTKGAVQSGVRKVLKTSPGLKLVRGLDNMVTWTETRLDSYAGNSEEEETEEEEETPSPEPGLVVRAAVITPLQLYVRLLKEVKYLLVGLAGLSPASPRKGLRKRKQLSPRRRAPKKGMVVRLRDSAYGYMGWSVPHPHENVVENREGHEQPEKRKFEELSDSDNGDNDSSLGLEEALEMYHSDDDPDYKPAGDATEDSLEYQEGDTESDIETETAGTCLKHGESLSQIKDAPSADSNTAAVTEPNKEGHSGQPAASQSDYNEGSTPVDGTSPSESTVTEQPDSEPQQLPEISETTPRDRNLPLEATCNQPGENSELQASPEEAVPGQDIASGDERIQQQVELLDLVATTDQPEPAPAWSETCGNDCWVDQPQPDDHGDIQAKPPMELPSDVPSGDPAYNGNEVTKGNQSMDEYHVVCEAEMNQGLPQ